MGVASLNTTAIGMSQAMEMGKPALQQAASVTDLQIAQTMQNYGPEMAAVQKQARDKANNQLMMMNLVYLMWLLPIGAGWLIFTNLTNKRAQLHELIVGGLGIAAVVLFFVGKSMALSDASSVAAGAGELGAAMQAQMQAQMQAVSNSINLGFGGWLIGLAGAGLVATGMGIVKQTPGIPAG